MLDRLFKSAAVCDLFTDERRLQGMLDFEAALARAEADCGTIPLSAANVIASCCRVSLFSLDSIATEAAQSGNLAIPMVRQLTQLVRAAAPDAAGYVHWGATSQDAIDTGLVLQLREELALLASTLDLACSHLATMSRQYRDTPMAGRTWLQHAVPITFGLKTAGWLDAMLRHRERLDQLRERVLVLQFGGAAGTLASLGSQGLEIAAALAKNLGLDLPATPWHSHRDRLVEVATLHGLIIGTVGKIARDLSLLMQTEVAEVAEATAPGRGASSTMPHKRNAVSVASILSSAIRVPGLVGTMLAAMSQEQERGLGGWQAEWETLPEICTLTLPAVERLATTLEGLSVYPETMRANLDQTRGLLLAEAVSMALAPKIGRDRAHTLVESASHRAVDRAVSLRDVIESDADLMQYFDREALDRVFDPANYAGQSSATIDRVLQTYEAQQQVRNTKEV